MAHRLSWWWVAAVGGCLAVAAGYLPPRGTNGRAREAALARSQRPSSEAERVAALAAEWRNADLTLLFTQQRGRLAPAIDAARDADRPTIVLSQYGPVEPNTRARLATGLDSIWHGLGLGTTKIGAGVVVMAAVDTPGSARPRRMPRFSPAYFFPDSLDRTMCLGLVEVGTGTRARRIMGDPLSLARGLLGPCAFYAAFGKPGPRIERWLSARRYDVALYAAWDLDLAHARRDTRWFTDYINMPRAQRRWIWGWLYQAPPSTVGCIAGRADACAAFVIAGSDAQGKPSSVSAIDNRRRGPPLPGATQLLSDALREFGPARFARFWTSDLRPDSAFALAMDTTLGDWMAARQLTITPRLPLGPSVPLKDSLLGLVLVVLCISVAVQVARRRQVS
jgi:hypothetical protein